MSRKYDMHTHTKASDGKANLEELVPIAERQHLGGFCVTDHDTVQAAMRAHVCSSQKVEVIPGIELSCKLYGDYLIELIGYFVDPFDEDKLRESCDINKEFRIARMKKMIWKFNEMSKKQLKDSAKKLGLRDWEITYDEVERAAGKDADSIGLNHFNQVLVNRGLYSGRDAFRTILNKQNDKNCYIEREAVEIGQALEAIMSSGGVVGIPHPGLVAADYPQEMTDEKFIHMVLPYFGKKIMAIEVDYPYCKVRPECRKSLMFKEGKFKKIAEQYNLIPVNGSDGHQKPDGPVLGEKRTHRDHVEKLRSLSTNKRLVYQ